MCTRLCIALSVWGLMLASPVRAWTNAQVEGFRGEVALAADGKADVVLDLSVRVLGGWLERFELSALGPDFDSAVTPAAELKTEDGTVMTPSVEAKDGGLVLRFPKAEAARRGAHQLRIRYGAQLGARSGPSGRALYELSFDGFAQALARAELIVRAPAGTRFVPADDGAPRPRVRAVGGGQELSFLREPWPRATAWRVAIELAPRGVAQPARLESEPRRSILVGLALALWVVGFGTLARISFRLRARRAGSNAEPFLPTTPLKLAVLALAAGGAWALSLPLACALLALTGLVFVDRVRERPTASSESLVRDLDARDLRTARLRRWAQRLGPLVATDGTSWGGAAILVGLLSVPWWLPSSLEPREPWACGLLAVAPLLFATSQRRLARSPEEQLASLLGFAGAASAVPCAFRLMGGHDLHEQLIEPWLRITLPARQAGLLLLDARPSRERGADHVWLCATVESGSRIESWLLELWPWAERRPAAHPSRTVLWVPVSDLGDALLLMLSFLGDKTQAAVAGIDQAA